MNRALLFLLTAFSLLAQQTVNNFAVKTNLTVAGTPVTLSVNSISDLMALNPVTDNAQVSVAGYHAPGDGGGGLFRRVAASTITNASSMSFISAANTNYGWNRIWDGGPVNVRWFGAKGDAVTDDTAAIQAAIDFAEAPTYGPGFDNPNANTAAVHLSVGEYYISQIRIDRLTELSGFPGQTDDINNGTMLHQIAGFQGSAIKVGTSNTKPMLANFTLLGRAEQNATNHVPILSSSGRYSFTVPTNALPQYHSNSLSYPWFSHCFFYGPPDGGTRRYYGSGWVTNIDYTTGQVTLRDQTDWYATLATNGLTLSTNMAVIFSPLTTNGTWVGYSGVYAPAGNTAIELNGRGHSRLINLDVQKFHVGVLNNDANVIQPMSGSIIARNQYFNLGGYSAGINSDSFINSTYLQGYYIRDYDLPVETQVLTNWSYRRTVFNSMNPGFADDFSQVTFDGALVSRHQARATDIQISGGLNDAGPIGAVWLDGPVGMRNAFRSSSHAYRSQFAIGAAAGEPGQVLNTTNASFLLKSTVPTPAFVTASMDNLTAVRVYEYINNNTNNAIAPYFNYGFILPTSSYVTIGSVMDRRAITTFRTTGSDVRRDGTADVIQSASDAGTGYFFPDSAKSAFAINDEELFRTDSTGTTIGQTNFNKSTAPLTVLGGTGGTPVFSMRREVGTSQRFDWYISTSLLGLRDQTLSSTMMTLSSAANSMFLTGGGNTTSATQYSFGIGVKPVSGTDVTGGTLALAPGTGTGAGASAAINIFVPQPHASGTTAQTNVVRAAFVHPSTPVSGDTAFIPFYYDGSAWQSSRMKRDPTSGVLYQGTYAGASTAGIAPAFVTLTSGTTVAWTMDSAKAVQNAYLTLSTNAALSISGITNGMTGVLLVQQDGVGGRTIALPSPNSKVANGGAGAVTLTGTAGAVDRLTFTYNGTNYFWNIEKNYN